MLEQWILNLVLGGFLGIKGPTKRVYESPISYYTVTREYKRIEPTTRVLGDPSAPTFIEVNPGKQGLAVIERRQYFRFGVPVFTQSHYKVLEQASPRLLQSAIVVNGQRIPFTRRMRFKITAYSPEELAKDPNAGDPYTTATGAKVQKGVVAVDPRMIPLGTCMYIPGYGFAKALDTGGNIKQHRIDIAVNSTQEALKWGVRFKWVYFIDCKYLR